MATAFIGDRERTRLQETGEVWFGGVIPLAELLSMLDDLGIDVRDVYIDNDGILTWVRVHQDG